MRYIPRRLRTRLARWTCLINNAAIIQLLDLMDEDTPVETWLKEMEVNVQGTLRVTHRFLPMLKEASTATIVNFTSGLAYVPIADAPFYSASKAALASWTKIAEVSAARYKCVGRRGQPTRGRHKDECRQSKL